MYAGTYTAILNMYLYCNSSVETMLTKQYLCFQDTCMYVSHFFVLLIISINTEHWTA